jgi:orotate phosphoribosyltransferase
MKNREVAQLLLEVKAVEFNVEEPFTFVSGIRSPVYTDCRLLMSYPVERSRVVEIMQSVVEEEIGVDNVDVISGTASAGIPHAAWLSWALGKPMVFVRKKAKGHGLEKNIEGVVPAGLKVLLVEDLVSTGGSSIDAVNVLRDSGAVVKHCASIFTYGLPEAVKLFSEAGVELHALTDFETAVEAAVKINYLTEEEGARALEWKSDPRGWADKQ